MKIKRKSPITLLEIMIVIFLIALVGGVIGYNMKGSLEKGKAFRTEEAQKQIRDILLMMASEKERDLKTVIEDPAKYLKLSGLVKDEKKLLKDGWGNDFEIRVSKEGDDLVIHSDSLVHYQNKQRGIESRKNYSLEDEDEDY